MMRRFIYMFVTIVLTFTVQGCVHEFEIDVTAERKMFLQCFPGSRDTTVIQLYGTIPLGGLFDTTSLLESADIEFKVDGTPRPVQKTDEQTGSVFPGCWFVPGTLDCGSDIEIMVACGDINPISARTTVPEPLPEFDYLLTKRNTISVSFVDNNGYDTYYGLAVFCERTVDNDTVHDVQTVSMDPLDDSGKIAGVSYNRTYMDISFDGRTIGDSGCGYDIVRVWSNREFEGGNVELSAKLLLDGGKFNNVYSPYEYPIQYRYKVRVYRFSKELFLFAQGMFLSTYDVNVADVGGVPIPRLGSWGKYGITPPVLSFSNVTGGLGVAAAWTMRETDWITVD